MKLVLCLLFTVYGSLQALTTNILLSFRTMLLISLFASLCTLAGFLAGNLFLSFCQLYTPLELTSICFIFVLLYLLEVKPDSRQPKRQCLKFFVMGLSHFGTGILCAFQSFPAWLCLFLSFFIELAFLKNRSIFPKWMTQRPFSLFLVGLILLILFSSQ